jgi:hypothetical protein
MGNMIIKIYLRKRNTAMENKIKKSRDRENKFLKKSVAIFEGVVMILSVIIFSYGIGKDINFISATTPSNCDLTSNLLKVGGAIFTTGVTATILYFGAKTIASWIPGVSEETSNEAGLWTAGGYLAGELIAWGLKEGLKVGLNNIVIGNVITINPLGILGAVMAITFYAVFIYTEEKTEVVSFSCLPWQPQSKDQRCEECNEPIFGTGEVRCSKYRCESLGSGCHIIDTKEGHLCYWKDKGDVTAPEIVAWEGALDEGFEYNPLEKTKQYTEGGVIVNYTKDEEGCIPPYKRFSIGISLNKIGTCKASVNKTKPYEEMEIPISSGYPDYNHTMVISLAGAMNELGDFILNNKDMELFVRCEGTGGGYSNEGVFVFKYCVQDELDATAPEIIEEYIIPPNKAPIKKGTNEKEVTIYVDKPSECKWSYIDEDYESMLNTFDGNSLVDKGGYFKYNTTLTGLKDLEENKFYFNCKSYPGGEGSENQIRTAMDENYEYTLIGTRELVIESITPNNTLIKDSTKDVKVTIEVVTIQGYEDGKSTCSLKEDGEDNYNPFYNDIDFPYEHTQELFLSEGDYKYNIICCDRSGNCDEEVIKFSTESDTEPPKVIRTYKEGGKLKIITNEEAECVYDIKGCAYSFENGIPIPNSDKISHTIDWNTENTFYIKCKDNYNVGATGDSCTEIIQLLDSF